PPPTESTGACPSTKPGGVWAAATRSRATSTRPSSSPTRPPSPLPPLTCWNGRAESTVTCSTSATGSCRPPPSTTSPPWSRRWWVGTVPRPPPRKEHPLERPRDSRGLVRPPRLPTSRPGRLESGPARDQGEGAGRSPRPARRLCPRRRRPGRTQRHLRSGRPQGRPAVVPPPARGRPARPPRAGVRPHPPRVDDHPSLLVPVGDRDQPPQRTRGSGREHRIEPLHPGSPPPRDPRTQPFRLLLPDEQEAAPHRQLVHAAVGGEGPPHARARPYRPQVRGQGDPDSPRLHGPRRLGMGGDPLRPRPPPVQEARLRDALRRGQLPLRGVRPVLRRRESRRSQEVVR